MLSVDFVRNNLETVKNALGSRNSTVSLEPFENLDKERRQAITERDNLKAKCNRLSEEIGALMKAKQREEAAPKQQEVVLAKARIKELEQLIEETETKLSTILLTIPNLPHQSVPLGADEHANKEIRRWGKPREFDFEIKDHIDIGNKLGILDQERATKITGARFSILRGLGARLERALINFMLDIQTKEHGYQEVLPPFIVNSATLQGTGQLPKFAEDLFKLEKSDYWLIPTAEVPLTNIYRDEILEGDILPINLTAYTPCFRSEAGSYGKDVRGLIRQHQFDKVELVKISHPDQSYQDLETLTQNAEVILQRLELPYRVVLLSTGDMGFSASKTYDLEVWLPSQNTYREISSCSNCDAFQARRAQIRFRRSPGAKPEPVHTLNGSGLAVGRTWLAILENYQNADGSVTVPQALRPYLDGLEKIQL
ncbi:MAG: serine--tRNA ligase [Acidobacteria bacterium]|nr:serine--tRNA ligase [Acidobacteriota bacterium]